MMSTVQCIFSLGNGTPEGRGEEKGGSAKFQNKVHITFDIIIT